MFLQMNDGIKQEMKGNIVHSHWIATGTNKTQKATSPNAQAKLKRKNTTFLCNNKQNNHELSVINLKSSSSTIELNQLQVFLISKFYSPAKHRNPSTNINLNKLLA
jgi:hypothetical protein